MCFLYTISRTFFSTHYFEGTNIDIKKLMTDLKLFYAAFAEEIALNQLDLFKNQWDFKYPEAVICLIYTTNAIEGFNRQLPKITKSKTVFPSDDGLLKMLYLATMDITKKWAGHRQNWGQIHSQLEIYFEERLENRSSSKYAFFHMASWICVKIFV